MVSILNLVLPMLLAIFGYPEFGQRYGEKWDIVRQVSVLLMTVYFWLDMSMRLSAFSEGEYRFYKSAGARSEQIVYKFAALNLSFLFLWAGLSFVCIYNGRPAENIISWLQMLIFMAAAALITFEILHLKCRKLLGIGGICIAGVIFICLIAEIVASGADGMNGASFEKICDTNIMQAVRSLLLEINLVLLVLVCVAFVAAAAILKLFDDRLIEPFNHGFSTFLKKRKTVFQTEDPAARAYLEAKRVLGLKAYVAALILEFIFAALGIVVYLIFKRWLLGWFYFFAVISGLVAEALYTVDIPSKILYKLLGAEFKSWFAAKIGAVFILGLPLLFIYLVGMMIGGVNLLEFLLILLVFFGASFCLSAFYAGKYLKMTYRNGIMYAVETILAVLAAFIPLVNIGVGYILADRAEKKWKRLMGD